MFSACVYVSRLYNASCEVQLPMQMGPVLCCTLDNVPLIRSDIQPCWLCRNFSRQSSFSESLFSPIFYKWTFVFFYYFLKFFFWLFTFSSHFFFLILHWLENYTCSYSNKETMVFCKRWDSEALESCKCDGPTLQNLSTADSSSPLCFAS